MGLDVPKRPESSIETTYMISHYRLHSKVRDQQQSAASYEFQSVFDLIPTQNKDWGCRQFSAKFLPASFRRIFAATQVYYASWQHPNVN